MLSESKNICEKRFELRKLTVQWELGTMVHAVSFFSLHPRWFPKIDKRSGKSHILIGAKVPTEVPTFYDLISLLTQYDDLILRAVGHKAPGGHADGRGGEPVGRRGQGKLLHPPTIWN